jgi:hypothetical protein
MAEATGGVGPGGRGPAGPPFPAGNIGGLAGVGPVGRGPAGPPLPAGNTGGLAAGSTGGRGPWLPLARPEASVGAGVPRPAPATTSPAPAAVSPAPGAPRPAPPGGGGGTTVPALLVAAWGFAAGCPPAPRPAIARSGGIRRARPGPHGGRTGVPRRRTLGEDAATHTHEDTITPVHAASVVMHVAPGMAWASYPAITGPTSKASTQDESGPNRPSS